MPYYSRAVLLASRVNVVCRVFNKWLKTMIIRETTTYLPGFKVYKIYPFGVDGKALYKGGQNYRWACEFFGRGYSGEHRREVILDTIRLRFGLNPRQ